MAAAAAGGIACPASAFCVRFAYLLVSREHLQKPQSCPQQQRCRVQARQASCPDCQLPLAKLSSLHPRPPPPRPTRRRHHGDADISSGGVSAEGWRTSADDAATAAAVATAPLAMAEINGGSDPAVRGGQLFGHLAADRSAGGGAMGSVGQGPSEEGGGQFLPMLRVNSGASEVAFGLEMSGVSRGGALWCCSW